MIIVEVRRLWQAMRCVASVRLLGHIVLGAYVCHCSSQRQQVVTPTVKYFYGKEKSRAVGRGMWSHNRTAVVGRPPCHALISQQPGSRCAVTGVEALGDSCPHSNDRHSQTGTKHACQQPQDKFCPTSSKGGCCCSNTGTHCSGRHPPNSISEQQIGHTHTPTPSSQHSWL